MYCRCMACKGLPHKVNSLAAMSSSAEYWSLLEHDTVAPERSVGMLVVIVEVSGDLDVKLK